MNRSKVLRRLLQTAIVVSLMMLVAAVVIDKYSIQLFQPDTQTAVSRSPYGPYLAGKFARANRDAEKAANFYKQTLERDPTNEHIIEEAFILEITTANWQRATQLAEQLIVKDPTHGLAQTYLAINAFRNGNYADANKKFSVKMRGPIADVTAALSRAWTFHAEGKSNAALALLDTGVKADWVKFYKLYHRALIADLSDNTSLADDTFQTIFAKDRRPFRVASVYARYAAQKGKWDLAEKILEKNMANTDGIREGNQLLQMIRTKQQPPRLVETATDGLAEVYFWLGNALAAERGVDMATIYLQFALRLKPDFPSALAALADNYEQIARFYEVDGKANELSKPKYELANAAYNKIPKTHPLWSAIQIDKAYNLNSLERLDEATHLLKQLSKSDPSAIRPLHALGDILRSHKRFKDAAEYYGKAIDLTPSPQKKDWALFYSRGVCYERMKQWPKAEKDLEHALKLFPDQPLVLNYLGYSWVDQNVHVDKALGLIRRAVELRPNDPYFVDSLGWAYYRLKRYQDAVRELEKAVAITTESHSGASDPTINDHLGDAYWQVGRRNEARFQWSQALTLKPEPDQEEKIKSKLKTGLVETNGIKTVTKEREAKAKTSP